MAINIAIAGIMGFMGRTLVELCNNDARLNLIAGTEAPNSQHIGSNIGEASIMDIASLAKNPPDVFIDFTIPVASMAALKALVNSGCKAIIIGTTGFEKAQEAEIKELSKNIIIVKSGNFSLGVNLLAGLVKKAANILGDDWDIEIIEAHHRRKIDAPSGTALLLGAAAANGRQKDINDIRTPAREGITGAREKGSIGFCAIRGGAIIGEHDVRFESDDESLILSHKAHDRSIFAKGAIAAAVWAVNQPNGLYDMSDVLGF